MKKLLSLVLLFSFFVSLFPMVSLADTLNKSVSESIPVRIDQQDKTHIYTFSFPKDAASIKESSIRFSGNGKIVSTKVDPAKREITIVFEGKAKDLPLKTVFGFSSVDKEVFPANPGNAMCRYSDGIRWQITYLRTSDFRQEQKDYSSNSAAPADIPYNNLMRITTASKPSIPTSSIFWFDGIGDNAKPVDSKNVNMEKINVPKGAAKSTMSSSYNGQIVYPRDYDPYNPYIGIEYKAQQIELNNNPIFRNIPTSNPAFLTGHAICKLYPVNYGFYVAAEAKGTVYDFGGSVSYEYERPSGAALIGTLTANPTSTRFDDKDIPIKLTIKGEVLNIEDPGAIDYYKFFLKNGEGDLLVDGEKLSANRRTTIEFPHTYTIPKSKLQSATSYTEQFSARIYACYKASSYYVDSKNGQCMDSGLLQASSYVYKETPPPPPPVEKARPVAIITADSEVLLGDDTYVTGYNSYDPDGTIEKFAWAMDDANDALTTDGEGWIWYDTLGPKKMQLCVTDNDNLRDCTFHSLVVTEPIIKAMISQKGTLKENRKVTFVSSSQTSSRYPEVVAKTTWTITNLMDGSTENINVDGSLKGVSSVDVLFKKAGEYKVTLSVENTAGYIDSISRAYTIKPDEAPYVDFTFQQKIFRDPLDGNQATFQLTDLSYSFDGDNIVSRKWYVVYDANNDGIFNELRVLFSSANETYVEYKTTKVGKYAFYLEVQEEFGQPTIEKFVTVNDRRKSNTWD